MTMSETIATADRITNRVMRRIPAVHFDREGLLQEGRIAALKNPAFVNTSVWWGVMTAVRNQVGRSGGKLVLAKCEPLDKVDPAEDPFPGPAEIVERLDLLERLDAAVAKLTRRQQTVLRERFVEDLSWRQIAKRHHASHTAVASWTQTALRTLRRELQVA